MAAVQITRDELLDALAAAAAGSGPKDARTVRELRAATGLSDDRVRDALRVFQAQGRLVVHRVRRVDIAGHPQMTPAYTITPEKRKRG